MSDQPRNHDIYRMRDLSGRLLYIGVTNGGLRRFMEHSRDKTWWREVSTIDVEHVHCRREVIERIERDAIKDERPLYNIVHNESCRPDPHSWEPPAEHVKQSQTPRRAQLGARAIKAAFGGHELANGDRVAHVVFGEGTIIAIDGEGDKAEAVINFSGVGLKHLSLHWAPLKKIGPDA